ncbi:hypothetical protein ALQ95_02122 [Pseudomonas syringae pv. ribicola]|uniref:Uncharacterized protein n=1 Tax=Pseudomonas syringae pv. ribicola TaxID=55398 RepID=A0A3M2VR40_PSESI|nr:hypothetical protein ALQ95_02122 [Pseudomonas syringae pv. ribicola]
MNCSEVTFKFAKHAVKRTRPAHNFLLYITNGGYATLCTYEYLADQRVLLVRAVLELIEKHITVGLPQSIHSHRISIKYLDGQWDKKTKLGLNRMGLSLGYHLESGIQRIITCENRSKALNDPFSETVKRVAVEPIGVSSSASPPHSLFQVVARVDFESDGQNSFWVTTCTRRK